MFLKPTTIIAVALVLPACGGETTPPDDSNRQPQVHSALDTESLSNATFEGILDAALTLTDGRFEGEPFVQGSASRPVVTLVPGLIARGDLNDDDIDEAVVVLASNPGGSGVFIYLAILEDLRGRPRHIGTIDLGDRVQVTSLDVVEGRVVAEIVEHGPQDPMCCPTRNVRRAWRLEDGEPISVSSAQDGPGTRLRGHLVWGHEARTFTPCGESRNAWVINESGDELISVYEELTSAPYQPMFVEIRGEWVDVPDDGFGADFDRAVRVTELVRAESEGFGCRLDLNDVLFVASGNEPFWRLRIGNDAIALRTPESPADIVFPAPHRVERSPLVVFESANSDAGIKVSLDKHRCIDTMAGARYAWAATVEIDGMRLEGCAAEGLAQADRPK